MVKIFTLNYYIIQSFDKSFKTENITSNISFFLPSSHNFFNIDNICFTISNFDNSSCAYTYCVKHFNILNIIILSFNIYTIDDNAPLVNTICAASSIYIILYTCLNN